MEVFGCEYESFTAFETSNGEMNLILTCDSHMVFNGTLTSIEYLCIPRVSYCDFTSKAAFFRYMTTYNDSEERSHIRCIRVRVREDAFTSIDLVVPLVQYLAFAFASPLPLFVGEVGKNWQAIDFNTKDWNTVRSLRWAGARTARSASPPTPAGTTNSWTGPSPCAAWARTPGRRSRNR